MVVVLVLLLPAAAAAQAAITGVVKDPSGALLPGATVEASSPVLIEKVRSVVTDSTGQYRIVDLRPGVYSVTFTLTGFNAIKRDGIELTGTFVATVDAELKVGSVAETITVSGVAPTEDVQSLRVQQTVNAEVLAAIPTSFQAPTAVSFDGRRLIFNETASKTGDDVMQMMLDGTRRVTPLVQSTFAERNGVVSPDGRWLAYEANDSGRFEIHVRPFPDVNSGHWLVSTTGGTRPVWARSGEELFYVSSTGALMRVGVERGPSWAATTPTLLVKEGYLMRSIFSQGRTYDISPDGQRFLMIKEG